MSMKVTLGLKRAWRTGGQHSSNAVLAIKACQGLPADVVQRRVDINGPGCTRAHSVHAGHQAFISNTTHLRPSRGCRRCACLCEKLIALLVLQAALFVRVIQAACSLLQRTLLVLRYRPTILLQAPPELRSHS
jgi:hypothetical protein